MSRFYIRIATRESCGGVDGISCREIEPAGSEKYGRMSDR